MFLESNFADFGMLLISRNLLFPISIQALPNLPVFSFPAIGQVVMFAP